MSKQNQSNKWEKYKKSRSVDNVDLDLSRWQKYKVSKPIEVEPIVNEPEGDAWIPFLGKSALKGTADVADMPANLAHLAERGGRYGLDYLRKQAGREPMFDQGVDNDYFSPNNVDRPSKWLNQAADNLGIDITPHASSPLQHMIGLGTEFATSAFVPGLNAVKGASIIDRFRKGYKAAKIAAPLGATVAGLEEAGVNPIVANIAAIPTTAGIGKIARGVTNVGKPILKTVTSPRQIYYAAGRKALGFTPSKINLPAAQAARDLGVELPASVFTSSPQAALADQFIQKTPFIGEKLTQKYVTGKQQIEQALEDIYNKTGAKRTPEIDSQIAHLYNKASTTLPEGAAIKPQNTLGALEEVKVVSDMPSKGERELLNWVNDYKNKISPTISSNYGNIKIPLQEREVSKLIGTKQSLNSPDSPIRWNHPEANVRNRLIPVHSGIKKDIAEYGKTNPEWYNEYYTKADKLFGEVANREKLEKILGEKAINHATHDLSYNALAKSINSPEQQKLLNQMSKRGQLDKETLDKIQKLGKVSSALAIKSKNLPNPSGTAPMLTFIGLVASAFTDPVTVASTIFKGGSSLVAIRNLLTDKKFLDAAIKIAENPNKPNVLANASLKSRMKSITGTSSPAILSDLLSKSQ